LNYHSAFLKYFNFQGVIAFCALLFIFPSFSVKSELVKVVTEYLSPYQIKMEDGSLGGYSTEVIAELFKLTGDTADLQTLPWARAYGISRTEPNVLIYSIAHTKERDPLFHWVGSLRNERFYFWGLKSKINKNYTSLNSIKNLVISSINKNNTEKFLTDNGFENIYTVVKGEQGLLMLDNQRVDIILSNELTLKALSASINYDFSKLTKLLEAEDLQGNLSIAFGYNTEPKIVQRYQTAYAELVSSGKLIEIQKKWSIKDEY